MADYPAGQERLLKQLISSFRCNVCRRTYERAQVRVAARHEQLWIVSVRCNRCRNQQIFWLALKEQSEDALPRDVTDEEEERFAALGPVSSDDLLDVHEFLRNFNGDFQKLFSG
jgi:hypothetical protein